MRVLCPGRRLEEEVSPLLGFPMPILAASLRVLDCFFLPSRFFLLLA
jgi:hypothetical protein